MVEAATIDVNPSQNIQSAINNASENDTINVHDNNGNGYTYKENIKINKRNLTINALGNVTISAFNNSSAVFTIDLSGTGTKIKGFKITGAFNSFGIFLKKTNNCEISENYFEKNKHAIEIFQSNSNIIMNNTFTNNSISIYLANSTTNQIAVNKVNNGTNGIYMVNSTFNQINKNDFYKNKDTNILLLNSDNNFINQNNNSGSQTGIYLENSSFNQINENHVYNNTIYNIRLRNSTETTCYKNLVQYSQNGIYIYISKNNVIKDNTIQNNGFGLYLNGIRNKIYFNNFLNNSNQCRVSGSNNTFHMETFNGTISGGNYWSNYIYNGGNHGIGYDSYNFVGGSDIYPFIYPLITIISGESIQNAIDQANTTDGKKILILHDNNGTPYTYLENIIINKSLIIRPDGKVTIQSLNTNSPVIYINNSNSGEIFGITIQGSVNSQAIQILNSLNWEISYNNITNCLNGILFNNSNLTPINVSINHNNIFNNSQSGIWIINCSNGIISNNVIFNNTISGIKIENNNGSIISGNHIQDNHIGIKINNTINSNMNNNNLVNNGQYSLQLTNSTNNSILGNIISLDAKNSNSWGINIEKGSGNTVNQNSINNSNWGLGLYNTVRNQVNLNTIGNTEYGMGLYNSTENELSSNNISSSSNGMYLQNSEKNYLKNNYLLNNNNGISINISQNNTITQNSILNSTENGINIHGASNNTISYNTITNSGSPSKDGSGIDVNGDGVNFSTGNNISYNSVSGSYSHGIVLGEDCDENTIGHNTLESNGIGHDNWSELQLNHSDKNLVESNLIKNNGNDNGIVIYGSNENTLINNQISDCNDGISSYKNLEDPQSYGNVISSNKITSSERGISIIDNIDCLISANTLTNGNIEINSSPGIVVSSNTIKDLTDLEGLMPISLLNCPGSFVIKNKIMNWTDEISIENSPETIAAGNTFINYEIFVNPGQSIQEALNSAIVGKTIVVRDNNGSPYTYIENLNIDKKIKLKSSGIVTIQSAVNNTDTIQITGHDVSLTGFQITGANGDSCGIRIVGADNTVLINNNVNNNENGILLNNSASTTMDNNTINDNNRNFGVYGTQIEEYRHDIDTTNLINGKPIYYIVGNDITITGADNPGFIALVESGYGIGSSIDGVTISNNFQGIVLVRSNYVGIGDVQSCYLSNNEQGLYVWESTFLKITTNNILNNRIGIVITGNENIWGENTISLNNITNNNQIGVLVENCDGNYIKTNNITNNVNGISIINCNHISINEANNIENNDLGINVTTSGNEIVNNNFINNNIDVMDSGINTYDSGYDGDGNYWDKHQTPNIDSDPDHVDVPLVINENGQDNYPLTHLAEPFIKPL